MTIVVDSIVSLGKFPSSRMGIPAHRNGSGSLIHCTRDHLEEVIAKLEKSVSIENRPHQRLNMLQLIAHFRLLCMLEVDGSFAKTPGHAQAELAGIVPVENLCKLSHFVGRLKPTLGIAAK